MDMVLWVGMVAVCVCVWACVATIQCIVYSKRRGRLVGRLRDFVSAADQKSLFGDGTLKGWDALDEGLSGLMAGYSALGRERDEQAVALQKMQDEFTRQSERDAFLIQDVRDTASRIMTGASATMKKSITATRAIINELDTLISNAGSGATEQQERIQNAASTLEEINAAIGQMNTNAEQASGAACQAKEEADQGALLVARTKGRIDEVNQETQHLETVLGRLGERTHEIGAVIELISDIADQTNLLALNAAIEAARAGESGRGFAVVADEVRKLAEKTMAATREVNEKISGIQTGVAETVASTGRTTSLVDTAGELAEKSNHVLENLAELSSQSQQQVASIAAAVNQQAVASEDITRTMSHVDRVSSKTADEMCTAEQEMQGLLLQAEEISNLLHVFNLLGEGSLQEVIREIVESPVIVAGSREERETYLQNIVAGNACFELVYLTDGQGIQTISNIARSDRKCSLDAQAFGRDWSERPWFLGAKQAKGLVISDVYESVATGQKCVTVSSTFLEGSTVVGVVAADVVLG